ncbi:hypothetical protein M3193_02105 [Sporosarcina luteola]|uniref:LAGLIDADG family homing endonuclease n=1 Tax=Sporosarcina luteola TaxID=582850 RepID=UPI00203AF7DA|nr:LAGLIDADG family homing endonuclease [Sporosarcina luteola]MCM3742925.1 hypothetical protein [Sporosarcina luteola]
MRKSLTVEQKNQILEYYSGGLSCEKIGLKYNVSWQTIRSVLIDNGIKMGPSRSKCKLSNPEIIKMYYEGISIDNIARKAGVKSQAIWRRLKKNGVKFPRGSTRKVKVDESFFENWSHEMAYVLGLILTDGNMPKDRNSITITQKDRQILNNVAQSLGMEKDCVTYNGKIHCLSIYSVRICRSLFWLGITPNKSKTIEFPNVPKVFMGSFLRGVIDGDGWVDAKDYRVIITTASKKFAEGLCNAFLDLNLSNARIRIEGRGYYEVRVSNKINIGKLAKIIYKNKGNLYLERKYQRLCSPRSK